MFMPDAKQKATGGGGALENPIYRSLALLFQFKLIGFSRVSWI